MDIVSVVGTKGGVGKTTLSANIGGLIATILQNIPPENWTKPRRVLLIDNDIQGSLSKYYDFEQPAQAGLSRLIRSGRVADECITRTKIPGLDIIINDAPRRTLNQEKESVDLESFVISRFGSYGAIRQYHQILHSQMLEEAYSYIIIDTPGALGPLLFTAALGADRMISPILPETTSAREFLAGTLTLFEKLNEADDMLGISPGDLYAVINRATRTKDAAQVKVMIRELDSKIHGLHVCSTEIPDAVAYKQAATDRVPVHMLAHNTQSESAEKAYEAMHALVWELFPDLNGWLDVGMHADEINSLEGVEA